MNENLVIEPEYLNRQDDIRGSVRDWTGGKKIDLDKRLKSSGKTVRDTLSAHLKETLTQEIRNHEELCKRLKKWQKIYKGQKERKVYPYINCSNVAVPIARSSADALYVRIRDAIFNKRKLFMMTPKGVVSDEEEKRIHDQENAFNHYVQNELQVKQKTASPMQQCVLTGTGVMKIEYDKNVRAFYRYASEDEKKNREVDKYKTGDSTTPLVKDKRVVFQGPNIFEYSREDFLISSDALSVENAYLVATRSRKRANEIKSFAMRGIYDPDVVKKLTTDEFTEQQKDRTEAHGVKIEKTAYEKPYELWECWFKYDVDDDGDEDDVVVVFHLSSGQILKAIYNPIFYGYRPFVDFRGSTIPFTYDGEGVCEILAVLCQEIDTLHNLRLDRMAQINLPMTFYKSGVGLEQFKLTPGGTFPVDVNPADALYIHQFPDIYPSTEREEDRLVSYSREAVGLTPSMMGISTAERPVAKDTMVLAEEANKKVQQWIENIRQGFIEIGYRLLESFAQYQPTYTYNDDNGQKQEVIMPQGNIRDYLKLDLQASTEIMNMDIRRQLALMKFQLLKTYDDSTMAKMQAFTSPQMPSEFKKYLLASFVTETRLMKQIMADFDEKDPDKEIVDIPKVVDVGKNLANSIDHIQEAQQKAKQQMQQQGMIEPEAMAGMMHQQAAQQSMDDGSGQMGGGPPEQGPPMGMPGM